jgi:hypothetical protein
VNYHPSAQDIIFRSGNHLKLRIRKTLAFSAGESGGGGGEGVFHSHRMDPGMMVNHTMRVLANGF